MDSPGASSSSRRGWRGPRPISPPGFRRYREDSSPEPDADAAARKEDSARQAELSLLRLGDPMPEPEPEPEQLPSPVRSSPAQPRAQRSPSVRRKEMVVGPPAGGGKKKRRKKAKKKGAKRNAARKNAQRLPRIEGAFLGSVVIEESAEARMLTRRHQRKALEAKRPWRQPAAPERPRPPPATVLRVDPVRSGGFGSRVPRKVVLPLPKPPPARAQPLPAPGSTRKAKPKPTPPKVPAPQRTARGRYKHVNHGLPYMKNIKQIMTASKLLAKLRDLNASARQHYADSDVRVAAARATAEAALESAERLELTVEQRQGEVEAARAEMARQEEEAREAQEQMEREVAEAEAADQAVAVEVQQAQDAEARAAAEEAEAAAAAAEAAREHQRATAAEAAAVEATAKAEAVEEAATQAQAEQDAAEQALAEAERLVEGGVDPATGKKLKKQEKAEAAGDLAAKREHLLKRAPSAKVSDERVQWNAARLREAQQELETASGKGKKQRRQLEANVAQRQKAMQKEQSEGVARALEEAEMARAFAEEAREEATLALLVASRAQEAADTEAAEARAARETANAELAEAEAARAKAVEERQQAVAAQEEAAEEAADVAHAKMMLSAKLSTHEVAKAAAVRAREEAVRAAKVAEVVAEQSAVIPPPPSSLEEDEEGAYEEDEEDEDEDEEEEEEQEQDAEGASLLRYPLREQGDHSVDCSGGGGGGSRRRARRKPLLDMRAFVNELLDRSVEQLCLPEVGPLEFVKVKKPLRQCLNVCAEALELLDFDATAEHPTRSHEIDTCRAEFEHLRGLCEQKMLNGLMLLADQQLADYKLTDCTLSCVEALALCNTTHDSDSSAGAALQARFRARRRQQVENCRTAAQQRTRAVELKELGRERLRLDDARAVIALDEALLLDPENEEIRGLREQAKAFTEKQQQIAAEKATLERKKEEAAAARQKVKTVSKTSHWLGNAHDHAVKNLETASAAAEQARAAADPAYAAGSVAAAAAAWAGPAGAKAAREAAQQAYKAAIESFADAEGAENAAAAAGKAAAQAISGGLADAAGAAGRAAAVQFLEGSEQDKQAKSEKQWQEQKNAGMIDTISQYKSQVSTLQEALRQQAQDAEQTLSFAAETAAQVEQLQAEAEEREAAFAQEREDLQAQIAHGQELILQLERQVSMSQSGGQQGHGGGGSVAQQEQHAEVVDQLRAKLQALKIVSLHKKAVGADIDLEQIDDAMDEGDPKLALVELLIGHHQQKAEAAFLGALAKAT